MIREAEGWVRRAHPGGIRQKDVARGIYYAFHLNDHFGEFIRTNQLTTPQALSAADPKLIFPAKVVKLKSAWRIVDRDHPPSGYITVRATVPALHMANGALTEDPSHPRDVMLALIGLHVVFTMQGHPEFIWSTFEHLDAHGRPDSAPLGATPQLGMPIQGVSYAFYPGSPSAKANRKLTSITFDEATQTFKDGTATAADALFRVFPNSKSNGKADIDDDVDHLNQALVSAFRPYIDSDPRAHYQLVGAVWLEDGAAGFKLKTDPNDKPFDNAPIRT